MSKSLKLVPGSKAHRRQCRHSKADQIVRQDQWGREYLELTCLSCGKVLEQIGVNHIPFTRERVLAWVMPWGEHEGKRLIEIPREWLTEALRYLKPGTNPYRAIAACLEMFPVVSE